MVVCVLFMVVVVRRLCVCVCEVGDIGGVYDGLVCGWCGVGGGAEHGDGGVANS